MLELHDSAHSGVHIDLPMNESDSLPNFVHLVQYFFAYIEWRRTYPEASLKSQKYCDLADIYHIIFVH